MNSISPAPRAPCFPEVKRLLMGVLILLCCGMKEGFITELPQWVKHQIKEKKGRKKKKKLFFSLLFPLEMTSSYYWRVIGSSDLPVLSGWCSARGRKHCCCLTRSLSLCCFLSVCLLPAANEQLWADKAASYCSQCPFSPSFSIALGLTLKAAAELCPKQPIWAKHSSFSFSTSKKEVERGDLCNQQGPSISSPIQPKQLKEIQGY